MNTISIVDAEAEDSYCLSIRQLSVCTRVDESLIIELVENEVLTPQNDSLEQWMFHPRDLSRLNRAGRLMHEFELGPVALALVFDLLDEIQSLRVHRAG